MFFSIFHWLVLISFILFAVKRKWLVGFWKWILRVFGKVLRFAFSIIKKIAGFAWFLVSKLLKLIWNIFVRIAKGIFWFVPRLIYWIGWVLLESFKFVFYALKALIEILKP